MQPNSCHLMIPLAAWLSHILSIANAAKQTGIELRWPEAPFDGSHLEQMDAEWRFQLSWTLKFLNERARFFETERQLYPIPSHPYTEETVQDFVGQTRQVRKGRSFFSRFKSPPPLSTNEELLRTRCIQTLDNWSTSQILEQALGARPCPWETRSREMRLRSLKMKDLHTHVRSILLMGGTPVSEHLWAVVMGEDPRQKSADHAKVDVSWLEVLSFCNALSRRCGLKEVYALPNARDITPESIAFDYSCNGYRLPTEVEWEYAARGTMRGLNQMPKGIDVEDMSDFPIAAKDISRSSFSGSDIIKEVGWCVDNSWTSSQSRLKRGPTFGLHDMSGNVREWCLDGWKLS